MKITYIHHSSFLIEQEQALLLFDYAGGTLPPLNPAKELFVFVSHRHGDHFSPEIFSIADTHPRIHFILSDDIWQNRVPDEQYGRTEFADAGKQLAFTRTEQGCFRTNDPSGAFLRVTAFKSTDEGVAFLVESEGAVIYHAGDLNDWRWNGETKAWNNNMSANYKREIAKIRDAGFRPDVAMLPLDGRQEEWFYLGLDEFMQTVGAEHVFPMHFWEDYDVTGRLKNLSCSEGYRDKIAEIREEGQVFIL